MHNIDTSVIYLAYSLFHVLIYTNVHVVFGSHMRSCKLCALDLTIANTWVRF